MYLFHTFMYAFAFGVAERSFRVAIVSNSTCCLDFASTSEGKSWEDWVFQLTGAFVRQSWKNSASAKKRNSPIIAYTKVDCLGK